MSTPKSKPGIKTDYLPTGDYIIIEPEREAAKSDGGIIIPDSAREWLQEGKIIACGPTVSPHLKPGMFVTFSKNSEYALQVEEGQVIFAVSEPNVILYRNAKPDLFPAKSNFENPMPSRAEEQQDRLRGRGMHGGPC